MSAPYTKEFYSFIALNCQQKYYFQQNNFTVCQTTEEQSEQGQVARLCWFGAVLNASEVLFVSIFNSHRAKISSW